MSTTRSSPTEIRNEREPGSGHFCTIINGHTLRFDASLSQNGPKLHEVGDGDDRSVPVVTLSIGQHRASTYAVCTNGPRLPSRPRVGREKASSPCQVVDSEERAVFKSATRHCPWIQSLKFKRRASTVRRYGGRSLLLLDRHTGNHSI